MAPHLISLLTSFVLISSIVQALSRPDEDKLRTYIIHVHPPTEADKHQWYSSFLSEVDTKVAPHPRIVHSYTNIISGFAARLTERELDDLARIDGFAHAYPDRFRSLKTTHSPDFLGLPLPNGLWNISGFGEGVIIGLVDSGITPDHPSFHDDGMPLPPSKWKGHCEFVNQSVCNNKLIGARTFITGADAMKGIVGSEKLPVDGLGHGTHTASTAAGAFVRGASVMGNAAGTAAGIAPRAHVAMYKVCPDDDCSEADILAAMDAAVADGVDVLSLSLAAGRELFFQDPVAVGAFGAVEKGVFVSCAAGNSGPEPSSVWNEAPWILTVGASTMDRKIVSTVRLGNGLELNGESFYQPRNFTPDFYPLVSARFCSNNSLEGINVKGKIVLCEFGGVETVEKGVNVKKAGGAGMIVMNAVSGGYTTLADPHVLPASHVGYSDGYKIMTYINSTSNPTATLAFNGTVFSSTTQAPTVAFFSSRGPSLLSPGILKPDITGPGVNILAAWPPSLISVNSPETTFNVISGTSMSTPHLSGIAALIKAVHPDWSPAAIKSAIMTTADVVDITGGPILDERLLPADLYALGAGHVNPSRATNPGLVYDIGVDGYISYICGLGYNDTQVGVIAGRKIECSKVKKTNNGDLNYPSFSVSLGRGVRSVTMKRTVKNVGEANSTYWSWVEAPAGVSVTVTPKWLVFSQLNQELQFSVTFSGVGGGATVLQGYLTWNYNKITVRSPISITFKN